MINNYGLSNFQVYQVMKLLLLAQHNNLRVPVVLQYPYALSNRHLFEYELANLLQEENLGSIIYSPLDEGFLNAEYNKEDLEEAKSEYRASVDKLEEYQEIDQKWKILNVLEEVVAEQDLHPTQVAQAWLLQKESVQSIVIGVSTPKQLQ